MRRAWSARGSRGCSAAGHLLGDRRGHARYSGIASVTRGVRPAPSRVRPNRSKPPACLRWRLALAEPAGERPALEPCVARPAALARRADTSRSRAHAEPGRGSSGIRAEESFVARIASDAAAGRALVSRTERGRRRAPARDLVDPPIGATAAAARNGRLPARSCTSHGAKALEVLALAGEARPTVIGGFAFLEHALAGAADRARGSAGIGEARVFRSGALGATRPATATGQRAGAAVGVRAARGGLLDLDLRVGRTSSATDGADQKKERTDTSHDAHATIVGHRDATSRRHAASRRTRASATRL